MILLVIIRLSFKQTSEEQRVGLDDPASFLPTGDIPCFCDSVI